MTVERGLNLVMNLADDRVPVETEWTLPLSPRVLDLEQTTLRLLLIERRWARRERVWGSLWFGAGALEERQIAHWNNVLQTPSSQIKAEWHYLN